MQIAQSTLATLSEQHLLPVTVQVGDQFVGIDVSDHRAHRHSQDNILCALAIAVRPTPRLPVAGTMMARKTIIH